MNKDNLFHGYQRTVIKHLYIVTSLSKKNSRHCFELSIKISFGLYPEVKKKQTKCNIEAQ